jgi:hypothetical protein
VLPCDWLAGAGSGPLGAAGAHLPWKLIGLGIAAFLLLDEV